jgi:hypothetical protein
VVGFFLFRFLRETPLSRSTPPSNLTALTLAAVALLYLSALASPAIILAGDQQHYGWAVLIYGWFGLLKGQFSWLANVLLLVGLAAFVTRQNLAACLLALGCIVFGLFALRTTELPTAVTSFSRVVGFSFGYYLWMASFVALFAGAFRAGMASRKRVTA